MNDTIDYEVTLEDGTIVFTEAPVSAEVFIRDGVFMARRDGEEVRVCAGRAVKFEEIAIYAPDPDEEVK